MNFQFKIHGYFSLYNVFVEETEPKCDTEHCFKIYSGEKIIILAAMYVYFIMPSDNCNCSLLSSESDRQTWIHDIKQSAIAFAQQSHTIQPLLVSNDLLDKIDSALSDQWKGPLGSSLEFDQLEKMQSRANTIVHVCWQRACSISVAHYRYALTVSYNYSSVS